MKKKKNINVSRPPECPACHKPRPVEGGRFADHFLARTLTIVYPNTLKGERCPMSGRRAGKTNSHEGTRE